MQVSKELIRFFGDPLCAGFVRNKLLVTVQTRRAARLAINTAKNYEGVLVQYTCFRVLFLQTY